MAQEKLARKLRLLMHHALGAARGSNRVHCARRLQRLTGDMAGMADLPPAVRGYLDTARKLSTVVAAGSGRATKGYPEYSPDQARGPDGKWTSTASGAASDLRQVATELGAPRMTAPQRRALATRVNDVATRLEQSTKVPGWWDSMDQGTQEEVMALALGVIIFAGLYVYAYFDFMSRYPIIGEAVKWLWQHMPW